MTTKQRGKQHCLTIVSAVLLTALLLTGCQCGGPATPTKTPQFTVTSESSEVRSGSSPGSLSVLAVGQSRGLPGGDHVTTDASGQALITGQSNGSTCSIYVFHDTKLKKSSCDEQTVGNNSCVEETSAVYKDCDNHLIETPSGTFQVKGSWVSVTYLPGLQLSLVIVFEGQVSARPVVDVGTRELGNVTALTPGRFWYTVPDERLEETAQLLQPVRPRSAVPIEEIGPLFERLDIMPWMEKVRARAEADSIPLAGWPEPARLEMVYGGGALEDPRVQEAVLRAVPWGQLVNDIFGEDVPLWAELHGEPVDARSLGFDPEMAEELLAEAGHPGGDGLPDIPVVFVQGDEALSPLAEAAVAMLKERGIPALYNPLPADYAWDKARALMESGQPAVWLGWR